MFTLHLLTIIDHISAFDDGDDIRHKKGIFNEYFLVKLFGNYYGAARSRQYIGDDDATDGAGSRNLAVLDRYFGRAEINVDEDDIVVDTNDIDVSEVILDYRIMLDNVTTVISDIGSAMSSAVKSVSNLLSQTLTSVLSPDKDHLDTKETVENNDNDVELSLGVTNVDDSVSTSAPIAEPEYSTSGKSTCVTKANDSVSSSTPIAEPEYSTSGNPTNGTNDFNLAMDTERTHPKNVNCYLLQAVIAGQYHLRNPNEPIYYNPNYVYQYEHSVRNSFGYCNGDSLSHIVQLSPHINETVRYTRVHRSVNGFEYDWKCFDRVRILRGGKKGANVFYLCSITHKETPGSIQNYFLHKQMDYEHKVFYYYVKPICISDVSIFASYY